MIKLIIRNPKEIVEGDILHLKVLRKTGRELVVEHVAESSAVREFKRIVPLHSIPADVCSDAHPCCDRRGDWNGYGAGPLTFTCPQGCRCHD